MKKNITDVSCAKTPVTQTRKLSKLQREVLTGILLGDPDLRPNKHKTKYTLYVL